MQDSDAGPAAADTRPGLAVPPVRPPASLYAAFDVFPSRKGAAIHVDRFSRALFAHCGGGLLYVLGGDGLPAYQREGDIEIARFTGPYANYLDRALAFSARLRQLVDARGEALQLCHVRDIWGGLAVLARPRRYRTIFEVNALPSIELPAVYRDLSAATLAKIRFQEMQCLESADHVIVPSQSLRAKLDSLGVPAGKISVVPNGAELPAARARPASAGPGPYLLYFGGLQPWQGVDTLLRAFARLADLAELRLAICASHDTARAAALRRLATALGVAPRVDWFFGLEEAELAPWRQHAALSVAPLTDCPRNLDQGCAPLKILESMASGVPVVASDLPSVRELIVDGEHGRLVPPDRPGELARAIRVLLHYPAERQAMGARARRRIERELQWDHAIEKLSAVYARALREPAAA